MCIQLMRSAPGGKPAVVAASLLPVLLKMLHAQPEGPHVAAATQARFISICWLEVLL